MKVIVVGAKDFDDEILLTRSLKSLFSKWEDKRPEIIVKGNKGTAKITKKWGLDNYYKIHIFHPQTKESPFEELNAEIVDWCEMEDWCIVFHDNRCKENKDLIDKAVKRGLVVEIISYKD